MQFYKLKVASIERPIKEAVSIGFDLPNELCDKFNYYPGQHLIIKLNIEGKEVRRSYSLNSCPHKNERLQITVKRVKNGLVSNYLNDQLRVGEELAVMEPQGRFYADIQADAYKTYFLFAAGSGITPIISILKSVLCVSPYSAINLFYGNSNQDSIIFKKELAELAEQYPKRLNVVHTLSSPKVWTTWEQWQGRKGRIDEEAVEWFITNHPPIAQNTEYYICGPGAMNVSVKKTLTALGIPKELIYIEQFGGKIAEFDKEIIAVDNAQIKVNLNGQVHSLTVPQGQTILQTLKTAKLEPPYSCESGVCGTCVAKITKGKAEMKSCMALDEKDVEVGWVLTCQALPTTAEVDLKF